MGSVGIENGWMDSEVLKVPQIFLDLSVTVSWDLSTRQQYLCDLMNLGSRVT